MPKQKRKSSGLKLSFYNQKITQYLKLRKEVSDAEVKPLLLNLVSLAYEQGCSHTVDRVNRIIDKAF